MDVSEVTGMSSARAQVARQVPMCLWSPAGSEPTMTTLIATTAVASLLSTFDHGLVRLALLVVVSWFGLLALLGAAMVSSRRAHDRARDLRIDEGRMNLLDVIDLMRDTVDGTGTPYWPQRALMRDPLINRDVPLLLAWIRAGQPLARLLTLRQAGFTGDQISRHLSGDQPIDLTAADMLAALRHPAA